MTENNMAKIARLVADPLADARAEVQGLLVEHERLTLELIATRAKTAALRARVAKLEAALGHIACGKEVRRGDHTEVEDIDDPAEYARAALKDAPQ